VPRPARPQLLRLAALSLALAASGATSTASAAPAASGPPAAVAGTVTLSGSATAYVPVRLSKAADLVNPFYDRSVPFATGSGRYLGFVLSDGKPGGLRILAGEQVGSRLGAYAIGLQGVPAANSPTFPVPAGDYRLYLLADGSPTTVTARFKGLPGATTLRPARRVPYSLLSPALFVSPTGTLAVGGGEGDVSDGGIAFDVLTDVNAQFLASNTTLCFYPTTPPPPPVGYGPGCPGGGQPAPLTVIAPGVGASSGGAFGALSDLPEGRYGLGFNRVAAAITDSMKYNVGFLSLDAPGEGTLPVPPGRPGRESGSGPVPAGSSGAGSRAAMPATGLPDGVPVAALVLASVAALARGRRRA
jgi:hypothetical protein